MTALALDLERPEPAEARRLGDAFEAATRRVARQTSTALRDRAVTVVASADEAFHVNPDDLFRPEWWTDAVDVFILDVLTAEVMEAGAATAAEVGVAFDVVNPALERVATSHIEAIASWGQDMRTWVAGQVRRGMAEGLSVRNMAKALTDPGDSPLSPVRARLTAQTELIAGQNGANYATYTASGLVGTKRWMSTPDSRTRPSHVNAQGQERPLLDDFEVGGYHAPYPGASGLPGKERINCRCRLVFEPAEDQTGETANLAASAFVDRQPDGSVVYQGAMVAARVPARFAATGPGALQPAELHITLKYLGNQAVYDPAAREIIGHRVADLVDGLDPFTVHANGWGVLGGDHALVVYVEAQQLNDLHDELDQLTPAPVSAAEHPGFVPHFTLGYGMVPDVSLNELVGESFTVTEVLVAFGCTVHPDGQVEYGPGSQHLPLDQDTPPPMDEEAHLLPATAVTVGFFDEAKHPRAKDGKWGPGGAPKAPKGDDDKPPAKGGKSKVIKDEAEAKEFLKRYDDWKNGLSDGEDKAMRFYQSPGYALMNGRLRGQKVDAPEADIKRADKAVKDLQTAIDKAPPLEEPLTVWRGMSASHFGKKLDAGDEVEELAFTSTALYKKGVSSVAASGEQVTAEIRLPAGMKVAAGSARELVLPPGTTFKTVTTGKGSVVLEAVPPVGKHRKPKTAAAGVVVEFAAPWEYQPRTGGRWQPDYVPPSVKIAQGQIAHPEHQNPVVIAVEHRAGVEHSAETARQLAADDDEEDHPPAELTGTVVAFYSPTQPRRSDGKWGKGAGPKTGPVAEGGTEAKAKKPFDVKAWEKKWGAPKTPTSADPPAPKPPAKPTRAKLPDHHGAPAPAPAAKRPAPKPPVAVRPARPAGPTEAARTGDREVVATRNGWAVTAKNGQRIELAAASDRVTRRPTEDQVHRTLNGLADAYDKDPMPHPPKLRYTDADALEAQWGPSARTFKATYEQAVHEIHFNVDAVVAHGTAGYKMPVSETMDPIRYTMQHEYGHARDFTDERSGGSKWKSEEVFNRAPAQDGLSRYGRTNRREGYAEAYAEFYGSGGRSTNTAARFYAEAFGWKVK